MNTQQQLETTTSEFGFDEYIMPTTYSVMPTKLESFDAQLYPSAFNSNGYYGDMMDTTTMMTPPTTYDLMYTTNNQPNMIGSSSPESMSSRLSPVPTSMDTTHFMSTVPATVTVPPVLSTSSSSSTASSSSTGMNTHATITEKIAHVNKLPESFLPEFHQYSKETYENGSSSNKKRRRANNQNKQQLEDNSSDNEDGQDLSSAQEQRRQIHIQSEQKRRAQIKDGFEELRQHLPGSVNKKMSKAALLHRTVQHLQHLKRNQTSLLAELERMMAENEQLKKFQESVLQKQALERMYQMGM